MNFVKFYIVCDCDDDKSTQLFDFLARSHVRVTRIVNKSQSNAFADATQLIANNKHFQYGVIIKDSEFVHRRLVNIVEELVNMKDNYLVYLTSFQSDKPHIHEFVLHEIVPKFFYVHTTSPQQNVSCFMSRSYAQSRITVNTAKFVFPAPCIPNHSTFRDSHLTRYVFSKSQTSTINQYVDAVYCINLSSRTERLQAVTKRLTQHNIVFERYNAISKTFLNYVAMTTKQANECVVNPSGLVGCLLSHLNVMKLALDRKQKQILILEDDISIHKDVNNLFSEFVQSLSHHKIDFETCDIVHLGYVPVVKKGDYETRDEWSYCELEYVCPNVLKSKHFIGCHAYIVSEKFMRAYIAHYSRSENVNIFNNSNDWAIRNFFLENKEYVAYAPCPQLFSIVPNYSDNAEQHETNPEIRSTNFSHTYPGDYE